MNQEAMSGSLIQLLGLRTRKPETLTDYMTLHPMFPF